MTQAQRCIQDVVFNPTPLHEQFGVNGNNVQHERQHRDSYNNDGYTTEGYRHDYHHDQQPSSTDIHGHCTGSQPYYSQQEHSDQPHLPEIGRAAPLALPAGAGQANHPEEYDSTVNHYGSHTPGVSASLAPSAAQPLGADPNRSSLAYMEDGATSNAWAAQASAASEQRRSQDNDEDPVLVRERAEAEQIEREETERRLKAKQDALDQPMQSYEYQPLQQGQSPRHNQRSSSSQDPPRPIQSLADTSYEKHSRQYSGPTDEDPSIPYAQQPPQNSYHQTSSGPQSFHPISGTYAGPPPAINTSVVSASAPSPLASPAYGQLTSSRFEPQIKTRQPPLLRGESALGSKHGDVFVANRAAVDGGNLNNAAPLSPSTGYPNAPAPATSSGYYRPDHSVPSSLEPKRVNAGAFRRAAPLQPDHSLGDGSPRYGITMAGPSQAEAIRDEYRQMDVHDPLQAGSAGPRFDVSSRLGVSADSA